MRFRTIHLAALLASIAAMPAPRQAQAAPVTSAELESFLSIPAGSLDAIALQGAIEGSALRLTFEAVAGDILSFGWNFLTDEGSNPLSFNDLAFVTLAGQPEILGDVYSSAFIPSLTPFYDETGYRTFQLALPSTGTYTLGIGVIDVGDGFSDSALLVDDFSLSGSKPSGWGFEQGLGGFSAIGDVRIATAAFGTAPPEGEHQALLTTIAAPEPGSALLMGMGLLAVAGARRLGGTRRGGGPTARDEIGAQSRRSRTSP